MRKEISKLSGNGTPTGGFQATDEYVSPSADLPVYGKGLRVYNGGSSAVPVTVLLTNQESDETPLSLYFPVGLSTESMSIRRVVSTGGANVVVLTDTARPAPYELLALAADEATGLDVEDGTVLSVEEGIVLAASWSLEALLSVNPEGDVLAYA